MNELRNIIHTTENKITINLPKYLVNREVEVIVLPYEKKEIKSPAKMRKDAFGIMKGKIEIKNNFDEPLEEFNDYL
jgi:hypothetical protein